MPKPGVNGEIEDLQSEVAQLKELPEELKGRIEVLEAEMLELKSIIQTMLGVK